MLESSLALPTRPAAPSVTHPSVHLLASSTNAPQTCSNINTLPFFFSFYLVFNRNGWLWSLIPHSSICSPQQNNGNLRHFHMSERGFVFVTRRRGIEMCVSKTNKSHFGLHYSKEWAKVSVCLKFSEKHGVSYITQDSQDLSRVCGKGTTNILSPPYITTLCFPFTPSPFQPLP